MKRIVVLLGLCVAVLSFSQTLIAQDSKEVKKAKKVEVFTCWTSIDCEGCKAKIEKNIAYEKGVKDLEVDLKSKLVTIKYRADKTTPEKLEKAIKELGYKTEIIKENPKSKKNQVKKDK